MDSNSASGARQILATIRISAAALAACLLFGGGFALADDLVADDHVGSGMVLELSAVGVSDFRFRVAVDPNGEANFPLLDTMRVDGMSLADLRARLKRDLPHKVFHDRGADGRESFITLSADEIVLTVAEYRPVYVGGDVAKPGAVVFRPGMSVWQAVTLAGGADPVSQSGQDLALLSMDIRGQMEAELIDLEKQKAHAAALRALLDDAADVDIRRGLKANLAPGVLDQIVAVETDYLQSSRQDQRKERDHLAEAATQIQLQIDYLDQERKSQESGLSQQSRDLDRVRSLFGKGAATISQVNDEERQYGYAAERMYQVAAQLMQAKLVAGENRRKLDMSVDQRRIRLLSDLQEANTRADVAAARVSALGGKLARMGAAPLRSAANPEDAVEITLHRMSGGEPVVRIAELHEVLQPGDDLEVKLPRSDLPLN